MANLKDKKDHELASDLLEKEKALQAFRFGEAHSKTRNVKEGRGLKKEIAQILTELSRRKNG